MLNLIGFLAGTRVNTGPTSYRPIQEIRVGDKVWSIGGRQVTVTEISEHRIKGDIVTVGTAAGELTCAAGQKLFVEPASRPAQSQRERRKLKAQMLRVAGDMALLSVREVGDVPVGVSSWTCTGIVEATCYSIKTDGAGGVFVENLLAAV